MAVKMRLTRMGDKKSPFYRIVIIDSRKAQTGEYIDKIGYVNPLKTPAEINIDVEKAKDWLAKGVQPTETVKSYLVKAGVVEQSTKLSAPKTNDKKKKK
jgi:small subunit ribosomal protein S16